MSSLDELSVRSFIVIICVFSYDSNFSNCFEDDIIAEFLFGYLIKHAPQHLFDYFLN